MASPYTLLTRPPLARKQKTEDKQLKMMRGYPFSKIDIRRQKKLVKNADTLLSKMAAGKKAKTSHHSPVRTSVGHKLPIKSHVRPNTGIGKRVNVKRVYDKIYDEKMASHF